MRFSQDRLPRSTIDTSAHSFSSLTLKTSQTDCPPSMQSACWRPPPAPESSRALDRSLSPGVSIVATDLNQPMLDHAAERISSRRLTWQKADAQAMPFRDGAFDAVICQFGVMFFPDKQKAYREARRVLKPGGHFIFNVWDKLEYNEFADLVAAAGADMFADDPPRFLARTPYAYHEQRAVIAEERSAGFT